MTKYEVTFRPHAEADLFAPYSYIAKDAGRTVAGAYIDHIEAACVSLATFPDRGRRRDDIRRGLRTMGFKRRATIVFQVREAEVVIVRIFQDYERLLRGTNDGLRSTSRRIEWAVDLCAATNIPAVLQTRPVDRAPEALALPSDGMAPTRSMSSWRTITDGRASPGQALRKWPGTLACAASSL